MSSLNMGHIGSETRSIKENIVQTPEAAFLQVETQNVCLDDI